MTQVHSATLAAALPVTATETKTKVLEWHAALSDAAKTTAPKTNGFAVGFNDVTYGNDGNAKTVTDKVGDAAGWQALVTVNRGTNSVKIEALNPNGAPYRVRGYGTFSDTIHEDSQGNLSVSGNMPAAWFPDDGEGLGLNGKGYEEFNLGSNNDVTVDVADSVLGYNSAGQAMGLGVLTGTPSKTNKYGSDQLYLNTPSLSNTPDTGVSRVFSAYISIVPGGGTFADFQSPPARPKPGFSPLHPSTWADWWPGNW